jgi:retron-type reverse transcriptase
MNQFRAFAYRASKNQMHTIWVLKCDVRKFFASIDQKLLMEIVSQYIPDADIQWLIRQVVGSFHSTEPGKGLPLGNLTSQLFVNVYMNELDQFVKHTLKAKYYVRYADDFIVMSTARTCLEGLIPRIAHFLDKRLALSLHPDKLFSKTLSSGVDFLGWVHFPDHRVLRTATKRRMLRRLEENPAEPTLQSYRGMLLHGNGHKLGGAIERDCPGR